MAREMVRLLELGYTKDPRALVNEVESVRNDVLTERDLAEIGSLKMEISGSM